LEAGASPGSIAAVHFRSPSIDRGVSSFLWALLFAVLIWLGGRGFGISQALSALVAAVAGFFIFLFVRLRGGAA
jgi:hypothetical protein